MEGLWIVTRPYALSSIGRSRTYSRKSVIEDYFRYRIARKVRDVCANRGAKFILSICPGGAQIKKRTHTAEMRCAQETRKCNRCGGIITAQEVREIAVVG